MTRLEEIMSILDRHRAELAADGVASLSIFGSVVHGEARPDSDIDLLVEFTPQSQVGLFEFIRLRAKLGEWLGCRVDLVTPDGLHHRIRDRVLTEAVRAA